MASRASPQAAFETRKVNESGMLANAALEL
jgi:hypothetical protein